MFDKLCALGALAFALALLAACGPAAAQTGLVGTSIQLAASDPFEGMESWDGSAVQGRVGVTLCWEGPGGVNAAGDGFTAEVNATGPAWASVTVDPATVTLMPPMGPTTEAGCVEEEAANVTVSISAAGMEPVPSGEAVSVQVGVEPAAEPAEIGTFSAPGGDSVSFSTTAQGAEPPPDNGTDDDGAGEDTPALPGLVFAGVVLLALAAIRGRRT